MLVRNPVLSRQALLLSSSGALPTRGAMDFSDTSEYSSDLRYRWWYERRWGPDPALCWIGLNPSTGDTSGRPRPTLRKVVGLAQSWDLGAVTVVNLFSYRATDPRELRRFAAIGDAVGGDTDRVIKEFSARAGRTLAAWGSHGSLLQRGRSVRGLLTNAICLGLTKDGEPRHPLYLPSGVAPMPFGSEIGERT
jgi:hypothetical protein